MIRTVLLENFQSHKRTEFEFHKHFNAVVGMSNVGKTSLTRALEFLFFGKWDSSWVRQGAKSCIITLTLESGVQVIREKGEKVNKYILRMPGTAEQVYEGFGTEVPEPITAVLRIEKAKVDDDTLSLNVSSQHEPLFLLSKPGSFKAKVLGKLSGAHYLDYALRELNKDKKSLVSEKNLKLKEVDDLEKQIVALKGIESLSGVFQSLEGREAVLNGRADRLERLKSLFLRVQDWKQHYTLETQREAVFDQLPAFSVDSMEERHEAVEQLRGLLTKLQKIDQQLIKLSQDIVTVERQTEETTKAYLQKLEESGMCPVCFSTVDAKRLEDIKDSLCKHEAVS